MRRAIFSVVIRGIARLVARYGKTVFRPIAISTGRRHALPNDVI